MTANATTSALNAGKATTVNIVAALSVEEGHYRYAALGDDFEVVEVVEAIREYFSRADRAIEYGELGKNWLECRCLLHVAMRCDVSGASGCAGAKPGTHSALRGLYGAGHGACLAEEGVRVVDRRAFMYTEFGVVKAGWPRKAFMTGHGTSPDAMGAFFCYTRLFDDKFVVRVSRLLGPNPPLHRVFRYFLVFGKRGKIPVKMVVVADGQVHVEWDRYGGGMYPEDVREFVLSKDPNVKVGATAQQVAGIGHGGRPQAEVAGVALRGLSIGTPFKQPHDGNCELAEFANGMAVVPLEMEVVKAERVERWGTFKRWMLERDIDVPDEAQADYLLATMAFSQMPAAFGDLKARVRVFALVGDRVLKLQLAMRGLRYGVVVGELAVLEDQHTDEQLSKVTRLPVHSRFFELPGLPPDCRARATAVEALIGVVYAYVGFEGTTTVVDAFGLGLMTKRDAIAPDIPIIKPQDVIGRMEAVLAGYRASGGDAEEVVAAIAGEADSLNHGEGWQL